MQENGLLFYAAEKYDITDDDMHHLKLEIDNGFLLVSTNESKGTMLTWNTRTSNDYLV